MKLKGKLILAFLLVVVGVVVLSLSTTTAMRKNIRIANAVKNEKLKTLLFVEKVAALGFAMNTGIQTSANTAYEDGLVQARAAKAQIMEQLNKRNPATIDAPAMAADLGQLEEMVQAVFDNGTTLVSAVIDQEFAEIPDSTKAFKESRQALEELLSGLQKQALASLEDALDLLAATSANGANVSRWIAMALIGLVVALLFFLIAAVIRPISVVVARVKDIAEGEGDLTQRMPDNRKDEIGELAHWFNVFSEKLHMTIRNITGSSQTLRFSSNMLTELSGAMRTDVSDVESNAAAVSDDADSITSNINAVASAMEETSTNINIVASSTEELSATISEIAHNSERARGIAERATVQADDASRHIRELGEAMQKIGKITETINEIADQTNLLALNATIEAARAGEAGKGFSVVANEIKALALEVTEATKQINGQVQDIQQTVSGSVGEVASISSVVNDINDIVGTIAAAIEEQSAVTKEIAGSVANASEGIGEVNTAMSNSAQGVERVSVQVAGIHRATEEMAYRSSQANLSAEDLAVIARQVDALVGHFKLRGAKFDMGAVKGAHLNWRYKLHAMMNEQATLGPEDLVSHDACEFGRWLVSAEAEKLSADPAFGEVMETHKMVHQIAREVVASKNNGNKNRVASLMKTFEDTRQRFFVALETLYL